MRSEAACFAAALERTGRLVLHQLEHLPQSALNRVAPVPECHSLFDFATRLVEMNEFWVQTVVGGQPRERDSALITLYKDGELAYLLARYERWLLSLHEQLDDLPDTLMNRCVVLPNVFHHAFGEGPVTVRDCLLHAVEHSALQAGRIQLMCQLYADFERLQEEFEQAHADEAMLLDVVKSEQLN